MNIRNRILKLEIQIISPEDRFCICWKNGCLKILDWVYHGNPYDENDLILPEGNFCEKCKKSVSECDLKMQRDLELIYGKENEY